MGLEFKQEKIAEFVGIMLGDGNLGIYNTKAGDKIKKQHRVRISLDSRNERYTNYVFDLLKDIFLYVANNLGLKISPKWERMEIPIGYQKGELALLVMKGLFDTDGCLSLFRNNGAIYPRIEIKLCPSPTQEQISEIMISSTH